MSTATKAPKYAAPALDKGLDILEVLADAEQPMSLNALARAMGRTVSEIFRMVATLEQRAYLSVDTNDRYSLSLKMLELSHRQQPLKSLVATAIPLMRELAGRAYQSCHLSVYHDGQLLVVVQVSPLGECLPPPFFSDSSNSRNSLRWCSLSLTGVSITMWQYKSPG